MGSFAAEDEGCSMPWSARPADTPRVYAGAAAGDVSYWNSLSFPAHGIRSGRCRARDNPGDGGWHHGPWLDRPCTAVVACATATLDLPSTAWTSLAYAATPAQERVSIMTTVAWNTPVLFAATMMDDVCQPTWRGRATRRRASPLRRGRPVAAATPAIRGSTSRPASQPEGLPARWPGPCHRRPVAA
jgi:hypothetical protein